MDLIEIRGLFVGILFFGEGGGFDKNKLTSGLVKCSSGSRSTNACVFVLALALAFVFALAFPAPPPALFFPSPPLPPPPYSPAPFFANTTPSSTSPRPCPFRAPTNTNNSPYLALTSPFVTPPPNSAAMAAFVSFRWRPSRIFASWEGVQVRAAV